MSAPYLSASGIAAALGMGRETVRQLTLSGVLPAYAVNGHRRYLESECRAAIAARRFHPENDPHSVASAALARYFRSA